jgi:hypothetical protein
MATDLRLAAVIIHVTVVDAVLDALGSRFA